MEGAVTMDLTETYRGYTGSIEYSEEEQVFFGKVLGLRSLISYEGDTIDELLENFREAVDDYLAVCEEVGISPERAYEA